MDANKDDREYTQFGNDWGKYELARNYLIEFG